VASLADARRADAAPLERVDDKVRALEAVRVRNLRRRAGAAVRFDHGESAWVTMKDA